MSLVLDDNPLAKRLLGGGADESIDTLRAPFLLRGLSQIYLLGTLPDAAIEAMLPKGLRKAEGNMCMLGFYEAPDGWGITPFRGFYCGIVVDGFQSPDGTPGQFMITGSYSGKAGTVLKRDINDRFETNGPQYEHSAHGASSFVRLQDGSIDVDVAIRPDTLSHVSGTRLYLGQDAAEQIRIWTVAFTTPYHMVDVRTLVFDFRPGSRLAPLAGFKPEWTILCTDKTMTFGVPYYPHEAAHAAEAVTAQTGLLDVFDRIGKPAAVVDGRGEIRFLNGAAERRGLKPSGRLRATSDEQQTVLDRALGDAIAAGPLLMSDRIPTLAAAGQPSLVQVIGIHSALAGEGAALAVFVDPSEGHHESVEPTLRLLGLTPAEARLGALVGSGRSPREAALELGITENTARSTLKLVFDKLGISRQSELARIVARLE